MSGLIGQRIGQYEIISLLGRGGMATVYQAHQESMGRDVAIKVIKPDLAETGDFVIRFQREVRTVASLSHPHILKVFDYGQHGDVVYLVMELLKGGSLADMIRKGPLSADQTLRILDQVGSALDHAHRLGIIHRDLKPQNVMLDSEGNAFLTDFGIAKILSETTVLTQTGAAMGTPAYMPPEQWQGMPLDSRADIYALGVMLFEMLAGKLPFSADTPFHMMHLHVSETPPSINTMRRDLPTGIEGVIGKALAKNREDRFASAGELTNAFRAAMTGQVPVTPVPTARRQSELSTLAEPIPSPMRGATSSGTTQANVPNRGRLGFIVGAVVAMLAIIGGVLFAASGGFGKPTPTALVIAPTQTTGASATTQAATVTNSQTELPTTASTAVVVAPSQVATATTPPTTAPASGATALNLPNATNNPTLTYTPTNTPQSPTPTPTFTPSATWTPTITFTPSPNLQTRAAATFAQRATQTANAVASFTATATPNEDATLQAIVGATDTAVAIATINSAPSSTPIPLPTLVPTETPAPAATALPTVVPTVAPTVASTAVKPAVASGLIGFASKRGSRYQLYTVDASGSDESRLLAPGNSDDFGLSWATDGVRIAFTSNRNGSNKLYVVNADDGASVHQITNGPGDDYGPAWSPDGLHIIFHSNRNGNWELYEIDADGSNLRRLTNNPADDTDATWSADGSLVAFHSNRNNSNAIWVMHADGTNAQRLSPEGLDGHDPAWSPDGQHIVFTSYTGKKPSIYLMSADGSNARPLLDQPAEDDQPAWSPDSQFIVFRSKRSNQVGIYIVDVNGQNLKQLVKTGTDNQFPTWQGRATG